jgi:hypothetical protein
VPQGRTRPLHGAPVETTQIRHDPKFGMTKQLRHRANFSAVVTI